MTADPQLANAVTRASSLADLLAALAAGADSRPLPAGALFAAAEYAAGTAEQLSAILDKRP